MPPSVDSDHPGTEAPPTRRNVLKAGAAGAVVVPALAACGGGGSSEAGSKRLRVGVAGGSAQDTLDAHTPTDNTDIARCHNLYASLCYFETDYSIQMALAESVEPNDDATVWTVTLKKGLTFHDGSPINADSVIFTMRRLTDPDALAVNSEQLSTLKRDDLKRVDEHTVELPFSEPYVMLLDLLAEYSMGLVPEGYDPEKPVGAGPFKFAEFTPGQRSLFTKFDGFWKGAPQLEELEIVNFPDETARVNALLGGQVDAISQLPPSQIEVVRANPNIRTLESETGMWVPFTMRVDKAPFDDVRVRQAFRLIVDRQQMVDQALAGYGSVANDLYGRFDPAYDEEKLPDQREQDIAEAKRLLEEAGHGDGLEVTLVTGPISTGAEAAAQVFKEQASKAGVTVQLNQTNSTEYYGDNYLKWTFAQDFWSTRNYLSQAAQGSMPNAAFNETHWDDEEWLGVVREARATVDDDERNRLIRKAMEIEHERGGYIIWGFVNILDGFHRKVKGLEPSATGHPLTSYGFYRVRIEE
ncbi:ABC transporter substrate-binding protein [Streptomonospora wellingtoniae]|uniref:ABC transporter substrate-binding protein n=1 Tax=Streptomonospora wellingtoniae TaxID=3075544 RepID=A0ABU2KZC7_9ACTN|nr:ABC transporter substrate-binding protein [Streptomonospora sp. DSM 45055]MDT0304620.1 ABC transporter substrate-binding protein [Streptomonospora sp. DSM 45055]